MVAELVTRWPSSPRSQWWSRWSRTWWSPSSSPLDLDALAGRCGGGRAAPLDRDVLAAMVAIALVAAMVAELDAVAMLVVLALVADLVVAEHAPLDLDALPDVVLSVPEMLDGMNPPQVSSGKVST
jgi:hypothetical protein